MIKRYLAAFLVAILIMDTSVESLGIVAHPEEQQPVISTIIQETDETEEVLQEIQYEALPNIILQGNTEAESLESSAVSSETSEETRVTGKEEYTITKQHSEEETRSETTEELSTE